jgi:hypothetical protein
MKQFLPTKPRLTSPSPTNAKTGHLPAWRCQAPPPLKMVSSLPPPKTASPNGQTTIFTFAADTTNNKRDLDGSDIGSKGGQASSAHPVM